jgi:hypothetical protein
MTDAAPHTAVGAPPRTDTQWVQAVYIADRLGVKPDTVIREVTTEANGRAELWRDIKYFADEYGLDDLIPAFTTFENLGAVPAALYAKHFGEVPSYDDQRAFVESDRYIDLDLDDPQECGRVYTARKADKDREAEEKAEEAEARVMAVPGRYAAENLLPVSVDHVARARLSKLKLVAVTTLQNAGALDPGAVIPTRTELAKWCTDSNVDDGRRSFGSASLGEVMAALLGLKSDTPYALSDLVALAGENEAGWIGKTINAVRADNLDLSVKAKPYVTLARLLDYGAAVAELGALPVMTTTTQRLDSLRILKDWYAAETRRANDKARTIGRPKPRPARVSLTEFLAQPYDDAEYLIDKTWPIGGRVLLSAQYKAGKTTLIGNVLRPLVDGGKFLGAFDVETSVRQVVLIDNELDRRTLYRWLNDHGIENTDAVALIPLRGAVSTFDILDPNTRAEWAKELAGADIVILDCLRPLIDALGLNEDKDAGRVLEAFDELIDEAGVTTGSMVVTHMGHQNERARGDSRLLDWPDALWKIVRIGDKDESPRYFSALGRDVAVPEGLLEYDTATRRLTLAGGNREDAALRAAMPLIATILTAAGPGVLCKSEVETRLKKDHNIPQAIARQALKKAIDDDHTVEVDIGDRGRHLLTAVDPMTASDSTTTRKRVNIVGSDEYEAEVNGVIAQLCQLKAQGRISDRTTAATAYRSFVHGNRGTFDAGWERWTDADPPRPTDPEDVDPIQRATTEGRPSPS